MSPSTPPAELDDIRTLGGPSRPTESEISSPVSPWTTLRPSSPDAGSHKRLRVAYDSYLSMREPVHAMPSIARPKTSVAYLTPDN
jgi:hypothetical protein